MAKIRYRLRGGSPSVVKQQSLDGNSFTNLPLRLIRTLTYRQHPGFAVVAK